MRHWLHNALKIISLLSPGKISEHHEEEVLLEEKKWPNGNLEEERREPRSPVHLSLIDIFRREYASEYSSYLW